MKLIVTRFGSLCHIRIDLDIFVKLTVKIQIPLEKQWRSDNANHKGEGAILMRKGGGLLCNTVVLKLYCLTGYCKIFFRIPLFPIFLVLYLLHLLRLAREKVQVKVT